MAEPDDVKRQADKPVAQPATPPDVTPLPVAGESRPMTATAPQGENSHAAGPAVAGRQDTPPGSSAAGRLEATTLPLSPRLSSPEPLHSSVQEKAAAKPHDARPEDPASADDILTAKMPGHETADAAVLAESRRHTRRSFVVAAAGAAAGYGVYRWVGRSPSDDMQPIPLRRALQANAALSRGVLRDHALSPTYPLSRAETLRVNGVYGLKQDLVPESWRLQLVGMRDERQHSRFSKDVTAWEYRYRAPAANGDKGHDTKVDPSADTAEKMSPEEMLEEQRERQAHGGRAPRGHEEAGESDSTLDPGTSGLLLTMDDILELPRHELVTQFKCIEGWSQIVHWAGVRMADFLEAYPPEAIGVREPKFVYMETPDGDYYTGYDMAVCRHPQTLLVTEMMGQPLTQYHGAPLRLHMPTKYGYKQIKRIGLISYTNDRPDDYWTKLGYDWYAGL